MNNLKVFQNGLIKVYENDRQEQLVDARELHIALQNKRQFSDWIKQRIEQYGFIENADFTTFHNFVKREGSNLGSRTTEYALTLDTAKEIAMVENNEQGKAIRRYFIEVEKKARSMFEIPKTLPEALRKAAELAEQLEQQKPKVLFAESVETSKDSVLINELSKILKQNGYDIGQNRLFEKLREEGYLIKQKGQNWNLPTQKSMELGLFEVKKTVVNKPNGDVITKPTTKVTGKGQVYFVNKFLKEVG